MYVLVCFYEEKIKDPTVSVLSFKRRFDEIATLQTTVTKKGKLLLLLPATVVLFLVSFEKLKILVKLMLWNVIALQPSLHS